MHVVTNLIDIKWVQAYILSVTNNLSRLTSDANSVSTDRTYRRRIFSWALYDWANHAYITTTATTYFPPYFLAIAAPALLPTGIGEADEAAKSLARVSASNIFALTVSLALLAAAILAPVIGTYADLTDERKRILIRLTVVGGVLASCMALLTEGMWIHALVLYFLTQIIINIALGLNSSLLPHTAHPEDLNRSSSLGYAMGYLGGGLLLAINTAIYFLSSRLGISNDLAVRIAFLSVGVWWIAFSIPYALNVPEPKILSRAKHRSHNPLRASFAQIARTFHEIKKYRELLKMLIAFWFYMEGVGAIILLATAYGAAIGIDMGVLIGTLLMTQFVAFPYAILFGRIPDPSCRWRGEALAMLLWTAVTLPMTGMYARGAGLISMPSTIFLLVSNQAAGITFSYIFGGSMFSALAKKIDTKRAVIIGLVIYLIIPVWGYILSTKVEFFMLGWLVGTVQGGTQALSRTIYTKLSPASRSGEFFGFYGLSEKFAGILGPLLYGVVGQMTHSPRSSILSIFLFFIIGIVLLLRVDVEKGERIALEEEQTINKYLNDVSDVE
jgi:UMF1 family MFS transporter